MCPSREREILRERYRQRAVNRGIGIGIGIVIAIVSSGLYLCNLVGMPVPIWVPILILSPIALAILAYAVYVKVVRQRRK